MTQSDNSSNIDIQDKNWRFWSYFDTVACPKINPKPTSNTSQQLWSVLKLQCVKNKQVNGEDKNERKIKITMKNNIESKSFSCETIKIKFYNCDTSLSKDKFWLEFYCIDFQSVLCIKVQGSIFRILWIWLLTFLVE